jgi:hypothetical protein
LTRLGVSANNSDLASLLVVDNVYCLFANQGGFSTHVSLKSPPMFGSHALRIGSHNLIYSHLMILARWWGARLAH